jgi:hypothetical protein
MNRFILFMDVLGFSNLVEENTEPAIKQIYDSEFRQTATIVPAISQSIFGRPLSIIGIETVNNHLLDVRQCEINLHLMSNSLIAWTDETSVDSFAVITQFAATYSAVSLMLGLPHRGAISVGELQTIELPVNGRISRNVVGTGLIRAHRLEGCLNWSGTLIDDRCLCELGMFRDVVLHRSDLPIVEYELKNIDRCQGSTCGLVVDWPRCLTAFQLTLDDTFIATKFGAHNKYPPAEPEVLRLLAPQRGLTAIGHSQNPNTGDGVLQYPGNVKLWESPRQSRGFSPINKRTDNELVRQKISNTKHFLESRQQAERSSS